MSLFAATVILGLLLLGLGSVLMWNPPIVERSFQRALRSLSVTICTMGLGAGWFLSAIAHLGEADFGDYKRLLFVFFLAIAVLSFFHTRDFLAVRGASIFVLMSARIFLDAAFMEEPTSRLFMVSLVYVGIVAALYLGTVPFRLRDFFFWLFAHSRRPRFLGLVLSSYGLLLCVVAMRY